MNATHHAMRDELVAQIDLATERLDRFAEQLGPLSDEDSAPFESRVDALRARAAELRTSVIEWPEIEIGTLTAVEDLGAAIDGLEVDLDASSIEDAAAYQTIVDRQIRTWRARADRLRLQAALGMMEARDDLEEVNGRLDNVRAGVVLELREAVDDARDVVIDVRKDVEEVLVDVRHAVERAIDALIRD